MSRDTGNQREGKFDLVLFKIALTHCLRSFLKYNLSGTGDVMQDEAAGMDWAKNLLLVLSETTTNKSLGRVIEMRSEEETDCWIQVHTYGLLCVSGAALPCCIGKQSHQQSVLLIQISQVIESVHPTQPQDLQRPSYGLE